MECVKIKIKDRDNDFEDFFISGKDEDEIETKLINWYLECGDFEKTIEMIKKNMNVEIKQTKFKEVEK